MKGGAILQVTKALSQRLNEALVASGVPGTVFVGPLDDPDAGGAALILFLYRVAPNVSLRNDAHRVPVAATPPVAVFRDALPLDLYFLVTVGRVPGTGEETLLGVLGHAMQRLHVQPILAGPELDYETVRVSLEPLGTDEISRIWALFPTANYRTSVAYLATPVWIDPELPEVQARPVVEDSVFAGARRQEPQP